MNMQTIEFLEIEKGLTAEQKEAVGHVAGPMLVLAGAGSGKTRSVTSRIAYLIHLGVPPSCIVGVTFTNKAGNEMKERIRKMINKEVLISTFHSLGARILRESAREFGLPSSFSIYDEDDQEKVIKECLKEETAEFSSGEVKSAKNFISHCKNSLILPEDREPLAHIFYRYQEKLRIYGAVDFDDLIYLTTLSLKEHPEVLKKYHERWTYFMIDEYQDTNHAQYELIKQLVGSKENVFAVGDPDQSIYSWRGSTIRNIMQFETDFANARIVRLEENFRSTQTILNAANSLIENNRERYEKKLWSSLGEGEKITHFVGGDEKEEASFVAESIKSLSLSGFSFEDMAVFYRTNAQSRAFEDEFLMRSIPYTIVGGLSFYQRKEVKDILSFLKMTESDLDFLAFLRTINLPKKGIGEASLAKIRSAWETSGMGILPFLREVIWGSGTLSFPKKQRDGLQRYVEDIGALRTKRLSGIAPLLSYAIHDTGYLKSLEGDEGFDERKENLNELFAKGLEWDMKESGDLGAFLEEVALKPSAAHDERGSVKLMTLHNSKGLEFTTVFVAGVEEDLLPHVNSRGSSDKLEEERRLLYVGMTRAKEKLFLCRCLFRSIWGQERTQGKSRFMNEIDSSTLVKADKRKSYVPEVERLEIDEESAFKPGEKVMHADFGIGEIKEAMISSLGLVYKVYFIKTGSIKSLVAKYAPLQRLG